ncbi:MAG TPA: polysaccharide deacetylase [Micromonosporaceae bacterium]|nr:polysaccharide deacetylase [Micromonosporaceae bacterium]
MLFSGVSWSATGYEVEVVDGNGQQAMRPVRFGAGHIDEMIIYLGGIGPRLITVVDSTCGILDGRMMAAGLEVYRADPPVLPGRPRFGSVAAGDLALAAQRDLSNLVKLKGSTGTQTGRERDLNAGIAASGAAVDALIASGRCLSHGGRDRDAVAITFDDGPQPPYTGQVLDILARYGVRATFFCVGLNASACPDLVARIQAEGHILGNHTWSHPFLPELSRVQLVEQIDRTDEAIARSSGGAATKLFRPPYGSRTPDVVSWLADIGSTVVLWDVEPDDWSMPGADTIAQVVLEQTRPGSIILMHDGGGDRSQTVAALPAIIEGVLVRGLRFVTVDELVSASRSYAGS